MNFLTLIYGFIVRTLWPLIQRFVSPRLDESKENWWNPEIVEEKEVQRIKKKKIDVLVSTEKVWWPTRGQAVRTSKFGPRTLPDGKGGRYKNFHNGTDYIGNTFDLYAVADLTITKILLPDYKYPNYLYKKNGRWHKRPRPKGRKYWSWTSYILAICIVGGKKWRVKYTHSDAGKKLKCGQIVKAGKRFCRYGNFGISYGAHVHLEVHKWNGKKWIKQNPHKWLKKYAKKNFKR